MIKGVIFDMDGVIVDTEPLHHKAYRLMFNDVNIDVSNSLYESFTGQSTYNICNRLCEHFKLPLSPHTLVEIKRDHFNFLFEHDKDLKLIEGVLDLIKNYYQNGMTLVLASSASMANIDKIFNRYDLNAYFKAKLSGADLKASKPHPEIFINAAKATGLNNYECLVIEDSTNGIQAAKAANLFCVGFKSPNSKNQDYSKADLVIDNFNEINSTNLLKLFSKMSV
ncbi:HAD superfamily hydrolase (TIGR01509 family)/HAD superfamily hydrolase (TIGR01549 family) [Flavobacteriaceae bacterium MAR_2010_72]|nr:HAD superfamily hydrolase (TIGR01509 family)/HAD superfamily hydrolase (TIGR01549 family) [Flavobacteriaceae bacterium MAR_2010_72]TVZ59993.1 HAD superfamily hydrolase (TIGR01509 family)/HAD superfamily hydrolase (TIGR01549 family) [Flavobacteriaceae bacterium MAR_2010_105]